jgi:predicted nucleic acid-binding protein
MAPVLLDTTVLIDLLRGRPGAATRLRSLRMAGDEPWTCAINVEEIERGILVGEDDAVSGMFAGLRIVELAGAEGRTAGRWRREHARRGITLSQADCLVAAAALAIGGRLATGNPRDFPMTELRVEHWPVGT